VQKDQKAGATRLFEDLAERLRARLATFPGGRLDTLQELAREFDVSKATMQKSLEILKDQGLLESFRGKGTFVTGADREEDRARGGRGNSLATLTGKLRDRILEGTYRVGQALPKVGFIASQEGVSPDTVCAALKALEGDGLIRKRGKSWLAGKQDAQRPAGAGPSRQGVWNPPAILLLVPNYAFWDTAYHDDHAGKFVQNFYLEIERMGMETQLATLDSDGSDFFSAGRSRIQTLIESLGDRYQGAMFLSPDADPGLLSWLVRFKRPVVWLDLECLVRDMDMRALPGGNKLFRCLKDEEASVSLALETLARLGHSRIGFPVLRSPDFPWMQHRLGVLNNRAAVSHPGMIIEAIEHREDFWHPKPWMGPEDFRGWLAEAREENGSGRRKSLRDMVPVLTELVETRGVTAILAPNDYFAHQYYLWFREMGLRVPGDVALLSFDNNHFSRPFSISSIDFGFSDLSYQVAHIFLGDIPIKADARHNLLSRPVLMGRDTLGPPKGSAKAAPPRTR
jgi:DNA-binding transcriptional regulator YhcF (GntR family)/DNA-binding LacI/PurR family transcriptional regulator